MKPNERMHKNVSSLRTVTFFVCAIVLELIVLCSQILLNELRSTDHFAQGLELLHRCFPTWDGQSTVSLILDQELILLPSFYNSERGLRLILPVGGVLSIEGL